MAKNLLIFLLLLLFAVKGFSQETYSVEGSIIDEKQGILLSNSVISVLNAKDSTLIHYSRASKDGNFLINNLFAGDFIIMASYQKYTDFVERFTLDSAQRTLDIGKVNMLLVSQLLEDVIITAKNAVIIKGDTIEYDASKYTIQPNSKVEDLLSQLPGIQVDKDGKITAQGETVSKVLVDGEEFFGDDPTLVTKNIRGDMVDKVQLFDKKSDQATFTGIDDGEKNKTINIQLKEGSKNGMFGKVDVGVATDDLYEGQAMYNMFNGSQKLAAYGTLGKTGKIGLNWEDGDKYASSGNVQFGGGGVTIMMGSSGSDELDSFDGRYSGEGIPLVYSGGAHYSNKWNDKKESINANYKIGSLEVVGNRNSFTESNLPSGALVNESNQEFNNYIFRQKLGARYDIALDSTSTLKVSVDGSFKNSRSTNNHNSFSENNEGVLLNKSSRVTTAEGDGKDFIADALWNKKLRKKGRTLSVNINQRVSKKNADGFLNTENEFYGKLGVLDSLQIIDQRKLNTTENTVFTSAIAITEPLSKSLTLAFNYRLNVNQGKSDLKSFNQSVNGVYNDLDSLYSNNFNLNQLSNQVGATLNYNSQKHTVSITFNAADVKFKQIDLFHNETVKRSFVNLNPNARWNYKISQQKNINVSYYGNTSQPSLNQIQPVRENDDPLNIVIGNPNLNPSFRHSINGGYSSYKRLTGQYFNFRFGGSATSNAIVSNVTTDEVGKSVYRYENLKNNMPSNLNANLYFGSKIKSIDLSYGADVNARTNSFFNMINDELNKSISNDVSLSANIGKEVQKVYSIGLNFGPGYSSSTSSLQKERSNEGWTMRASGRARLFLPAKLEVYTDAQYTFNQATQVFADDFQKTIWNGGVRKKFLKTDELILSVNVNDILNQNVGFNRSSYNNVDSQSTYTTIKRYFMLSILWDFNEMGKGN